MCKERKNQLRIDTLARKKGKTPLLSDSQREDLVRRVEDDQHAIITYFKRIEHHYDAYMKCKDKIKEIREKIREEQESRKNAPSLIQKISGNEIHYQQEPKHYAEELERYASTLVHQCIAFQNFSKSNYKILERVLKRKKGKDLPIVLKEIEEKYSFGFHLL